VRLLFAGLIFLLFAFLKGTGDILSRLKKKRDWLDLVLFRIFGMLAVQLSFLWRSGIRMRRQRPSFNTWA
jgi:hypothetical protein